MFTFIPWILLVLQKIESSGLDVAGIMPYLNDAYWVYMYKNGLMRKNGR